jgi:hypothetical protein
VHSVGDLVESLCEILDWERFTKTSAPFVLLPVAFTSGVLVIIGFIVGALADSSSAEMSSKYRLGRVPEGSSVSPAAMKT